MPEIIETFLGSGPWLLVVLLYLVAILLLAWGASPQLVVSAIGALRKKAPSKIKKPPSPLERIVCGLIGGAIIFMLLSATYFKRFPESNQQTAGFQGFFFKFEKCSVVENELVCIFKVWANTKQTLLLSTKTLAFGKSGEPLELLGIRLAGEEYTDLGSLKFIEKDFVGNQPPKQMELSFLCEECPESHEVPIELVAYKDSVAVENFFIGWFNSEKKMLSGR